MDFSGVLISALRGGAGKTILSIGIIAAWKNLGETVLPFKKGPDYIDAGWLASAAGRPCYNLDPFLTSTDAVQNIFRSHIQPGNLAIIEGNRGLFDGLDVQGTTSSAELSKLLKIPVVLIVDCTKSTRTIAALVFGCLKFDPDINIIGVILNRVAGHRHETIIRQSIEAYCGIPVFGAIPKLGEEIFPERHMGLVPTPEHSWTQVSIDCMAEIVQQHISLDSIKKLISLSFESEPEATQKTTIVKLQKYRLKIGVASDPAFQFYYPENIEALQEHNAEIVYLSPLKDKTIPSIDGLYLGGGFPETHAQELSYNVEFRNQVKDLAENHLPIYAECGGLMYLGQSLLYHNEEFPMAGIFPLKFGFKKRPQGHGYVIAKVKKNTPYFAEGNEIRGHEFHYSYIEIWLDRELETIFSMIKGTGLGSQADGLLHKNVFASYVHIHAMGTPMWAKNFISLANAFHLSKK